jgi:PAS domain S-box-containing protein
MRVRTQSSRTPVSAATGDMFFAVDRTGSFTYVSPPFARILGYPSDELRGQNVINFIQPGDRARQMRAMAAWQREPGLPWHAESRWICGDGERILRFTLWHDKQHDLIYCAGQEVTAGRAAQERAALQRVAALVAQGTPPGEVFQAVTAELRALLGVAACVLARYESDGTATILSDNVDIGTGLAPGTVLRFVTGTAGAMVRESASAVANGDVTELPSPLRERAERLGVTEAVKVPVMVDGQVWGYLSASWRDIAPPEVESRMTRFTELVTMAINNADGRTRLDASLERLAEYAEEEAALRRVATAVAAGAPTTEVFDAVTVELRRLLDIESAVLERFEDDGMATVVALCDPQGLLSGDGKIGSRLSTENGNLVAKVRRSNRAELLGSYDDESSLVITELGGAGLMGAVGVPVKVAGVQWGMAAVAWRRPVTRDLESRLAEFTGLLSIAIGNADSRERLAASRLRVITAADQARQRIERDLHDGVQQRLVTLGLDLQELGEREVTPGDLKRISKGLRVAMEELREIASGIHPLVLRQHGLDRALRRLARRAGISIRLDLRLSGRLPEPVEIAAYYVVSELVTNAAKHAGVDAVNVELEAVADELSITVRDAGVGGATSARGTGLTGLRDRVEALGGTMEVESPSGKGTSVRARIPLAGSQGLSPHVFGDNQ